ncbi:MAG: SUMF1/EgtB/PvdO family nonheme iron enzyme [Cyanobacteria bacterium P01_A01_bin.135]
MSSSNLYSRCLPKAQPDSSALRSTLRSQMQACRAATLRLFEAVGDQQLKQQAHPDFSPSGWHLGHIGYTESLWIRERLMGGSPASHRVLFAQDGLPKAERQNLPALADIRQYLAQIRRDVFLYLDRAPVQQQARLWWFLLQHESQHGETIAMVHQMLGLQGRAPHHTPSPAPPTAASVQTMVQIPAGPVVLGSDDTTTALDNEGPGHLIHTADYWIDQHPVTCTQYRQFMRAGGYQTQRWWSSAGWAWLQQSAVTQPRYWQVGSQWDDHPVCGVSYYEAEAYAKFAGKRLPTEAEWEKAACWSPATGRSQPYPWGDGAPTLERANYGHRLGHTTPVTAFPAGASPSGCLDMLGNVWEWTSSPFAPYPRFKPYPYVGYSQTYFDGQHYVLRGGSWATQPWCLRPTFRNWYQRDVRQPFCGFRCATDSRLNL